MVKEQVHTAIFKDIGIDTNQEFVAFMPRTCYVCRAEGFQSLNRIAIRHYDSEITAILNITDNGLLKEGEIALSYSAMKKLDAKAGDELQISHPEPITSFSKVRSKLYGNALSEVDFFDIIRDIVKEKYSNIDISAFIAACSGNNLSIMEICYLTEAMIETGNKIDWHGNYIVDKHCIGGIPGNRTTMIAVPILASMGFIIPKTSSRAITSPSGTADTMEVLTNVDLSLDEMKKIVSEQGACIAWGGAMKLSPADDILIRVERLLDIDSEGQMIASILSKKKAAGSTHCLIDIPYGSTAKVRSKESAESLKEKLLIVAHYIKLHVSVILTDGTQPIGNGIGPALEARDVLSVLRNQENQPLDLRKHALELSAAIISLVTQDSHEKAYQRAKEKLESGEAYQKFRAICHAQGRFTEPKEAKYIRVIEAEFDGVLSAIDNRIIARLAKLSGAPASQEAGVDLYVHNNCSIRKGQPLLAIHSNSEGELEYALNFYRKNEHKLFQFH